MYLGIHYFLVVFKVCWSNECYYKSLSINFVYYLQANAVTDMIGYPNYILDNAKLDKKYEHVSCLNIDPWQHISWKDNIIQITVKC